MTALSDFAATLHPRAAGNLRGTARLDVTDEGSIMLDETGARVAEAEADVTLRASLPVFEAILSGDQNPVMAFMSGKLKVDGNTQRALKVSAILTDG